MQVQNLPCFANTPCFSETALCAVLTRDEAHASNLVLFVAHLRYHRFGYRYKAVHRSKKKPAQTHKNGDPELSAVTRRAAVYPSLSFLRCSSEDNKGELHVFRSACACKRLRDDVSSLRDGTDKQIQNTQKKYFLGVPEQFLQHAQDTPQESIFFFSRLINSGALQAAVFRCLIKSVLFDIQVLEFRSSIYCVYLTSDGELSPKLMSASNSATTRNSSKSQRRRRRVCNARIQFVPNM